MLADEVDFVIGVDTHKDSHSAAVVNATGGVVAGLEAVACESGYRRLLNYARVHACGCRKFGTRAIRGGKRRSRPCPAG